MGGEGFLGSGVCGEGGWDWGGHFLCVKRWRKVVVVVVVVMVLRDFVGC